MLASSPEFNRPVLEPAVLSELARLRRPLETWLIYHYHMNSAEAEDVAGEAEKRVLSGRAKYDPARGRLNTLLFRVAGNLAVDRHRAQVRQVRVDLASLAPDEEQVDGPAELMLDRDLRRLMERGKAGLKPLERKGIELVVEDGWSVLDAARRLRVHVRRLYRAIASGMASLKEFALCGDCAPALAECRVRVSQKRARRV